MNFLNKIFIHWILLFLFLTARFCRIKKQYCWSKQFLLSCHRLFDENETTVGTDWPTFESVLTKLVVRIFRFFFFFPYPEIDPSTRQYRDNAAVWSLQCSEIIENESEQRPHRFGRCYGRSKGTSSHTPNSARCIRRYIDRI